VKHNLLLLLLIVVPLSAASPAPAADFTIKEVQFAAADTPEHTETVHIIMNGLLSPTIFALTEGTPRVVCDFINAEPAPTINRTIETNGRYIKRIRIGIHSKPETKTRVVLDLVPDGDYTIRQIPSPKDNRFSIVVSVAAKENVPPAGDQSQNN
jgi:hypothetical protein